MKFTQVRHASCIIELNDIRFLVDPILYKKNTLSPVEGGIDQKNPLVDITLNEKILKDINYIILTHLHRDHFDPNILEFYGNNISIICSEEYKEKLLQLGFNNIILVKENIEINKIKIIKTEGKHGTGTVGEEMGKSYGFVMNTINNDCLYITGDTIWYKNIKNIIEKYKPNYIIGFAGSAIIKNTHITLNENDIKKILENAPEAKLILNHMDAWNHCFLTKEKLKNRIINANLLLPNDGETINV